MNTPPSKKPGSALTQSIGNENLANSLTTIGDVGINATVAALEGVPVLGIVVSLARAGFDIKKDLEFRKIVNFLQAVDQASSEKRAEFTKKLESDGKMEEFGQNILLLLSRLDDMSKPAIVGRILAAHIEGKINYEKAMRLSAIVDRSHVTDFTYLKSFSPGLQGEGSDIAAMLSSAGLLANVGSDGGEIGDPTSGGHLYELNEYAQLLLEYGLKD